MHPNYFIMLISFISPLQDFKSRQRRVFRPGAPALQRGDQHLPMVKAMPSSMGRSLSFAAKQTQGGMRKGTMERKKHGGGGWAPLKHLAILLLERVEGSRSLVEPPGLNTGLAGGGGVSLFVVSVFSDSVHSSAVGLVGAARVFRYQCNSFSSSCLLFPIPPDAMPPGLPKAKISLGGKMLKANTWHGGWSRRRGLHPQTSACIGIGGAWEDRIFPC